MSTGGTSVTGPPVTEAEIVPSTLTTVLDGAEGEEGALQGLVTWRVEGTGRYASASGTVASSFVFEPERGVAVEHQVVRLFLA